MRIHRLCPGVAHRRRDATAGPGARGTPCRTGGACGWAVCSDGVVRGRVAGCL